MVNFKKTLLVCWFGCFTTSMGLSQIAPILPFFLRELGLSTHDDIAFYSGLSFGVTSLLLAIFSPLWSFLGAKFGYKKMLLRASLGMAIFTFLIALSRDVFDVIILRVLTGIVAGFNTTAVVYIAIQAPRKFSAYALGTLSTASVSGSLLGPLLGGLLAEFIGLRFSFVFVAILLFLSFATVLFFIDEKKTQRKSTEKEENTKTNFKMVFILCFLTIVVQFGTFGIAPLVSLYVESLHKSKEFMVFLSGLVVAASGISNVFFAQKLGRMADRIGYERVIPYCLLFCGILFCLHSLAQTVFVLFCLRFALGIGLGGLLPCINAMLKKISSKAKLSVVLGMNQSSHAIGGFMSSVGNGYLAAIFDIRTVFVIISLSFILSAFLFLIANKFFKTH